MPNFHFTISDDSGELGNKVVDLPDLSAARAQAVEEASRALALVDGSFWSEGYLQIDVTDEVASLSLLYRSTGTTPRRVASPLTARSA